MIDKKKIHGLLADDLAERKHQMRGKRTTSASRASMAKVKPYNVRRSGGKVLFNNPCPVPCSRTRKTTSDRVVDVVIEESGVIC